MAIDRYLRSPAVMFGIGTVTGFLAKTFLGGTTEAIKEQKEMAYLKLQGLDITRKPGVEQRGDEWVSKETEVVRQKEITTPPQEFPMWAYAVLGVLGFFIAIKVLR